MLCLGTRHGNESSCKRKNGSQRGAAIYPMPLMRQYDARMIAALVQDDPALHRAFLDDCRLAEGERRFCRHSNRFPLCGQGDINTFALFAETAFGIVAQHGMAGIIVPDSIATNVRRRWVSSAATF